MGRKKTKTVDLARKYRPKNLNEVIGQVSAKYLTVGDFDVALLHGPSGTGKTSSARAFIKFWNCEGNSVSKCPCNECSSCKGIEGGDDVDVIEINGSDKNSVDDVRMILRNMYYLPMRKNNTKFYLIDEAHMLSKSAFNALLKGLEEPPSHVKFIIVTTEVDRIPDTIRSRCTQFPFYSAREENIKTVLEKINTAEELGVSDDGLDLIVSFSDCNIRNGIKWLEKVATVDGVHDLAVVSKVLGATFRDIYGVVSALGNREAESLVKHWNLFFAAGMGSNAAITSLMGLFSSIATVSSGSEIGVAKGNIKFCHVMKRKFSLTELYQLTAKLHDLYGNEKNTDKVILSLLLYSLEKFSK